MREFSGTAHLSRPVSDCQRLGEKVACEMADGSDHVTRILIDRARHRKAVRHGGELQRTEFAEDIIAVPSVKDDEILAINEILDRFAQIEPRKAEVVKLRYFVGMTIEETAEALGISTPTAKRDWIFARAWLYRELQRDG
ncbi:MAG: ECF-type sigma factor [Verrucomicrobia bacterium]|nr:ECF-type sigma factor [Verrucomicrobiota bacterium]